MLKTSLNGMRSYRRNQNKEEPQEEKPEETLAEKLAETIEAGLSQNEIERIRLEARERARSTRHEWRLKGRGVLACTSCPFPHRTYIPTNLTLTGIDENGNPLLQTSK